MAEEYPRCPVCYSPIIVDPEEIEKLRAEGIYVWTEDPLLTLRGLAGEEYKGKTPCRWLHVAQLQEARKQQEIDVGLEERPEEPEEGELYRTIFSEVKKGEPIRRIHIEELRISTEKILETMGYTKEDYFNYNEEGKEMRVEHQTDWVNPELTLVTPIRAFHIEDLRHPLPLPDWIETFDLQEDQELYPRLYESGSWTAQTGYWNVDYYYFDMPLSFWGDYQWESGSPLRFGYRIGSQIWGWSGDPPGPGATNSFEFIQEGSKLKLNFNRKTYAAHCWSKLYWGFRLSELENFDLRAPFAMKWSGLSLTGNQHQCAIHINLEFEVKKLIFKNPNEYETTTENREVMFYTDKNYPFTSGSPLWVVYPDGTIVFQMPYHTWGGFPPKRHSIDYLSNTINLIEELNYQWDKNYKVREVEEVIGNEYISKMTIKGIALEFNTAAYSTESGINITTTFLVDTIRFSKLSK